MSVASLRAAAGFAAYLLMNVAATAFAQEYQTALRISPQGGGRCIEVPNRAFVQDQRLQMMDCDNSPAQIFTYDQADRRLAIAGLCVDANGGGPGDLVKLSSCNGGANQAWKAEQKGNFTKLVGVNGLCLDIRYGSKESGAPLQSWTCGDAEPNQLWLFQRE
ncbi:MAG TPA: RICIN domain-containing protein [Xanthobacteraceae bacterium]